MQVRVVLEREAGVFKPCYGPKAAGTGDLHLAYRTVLNRRIAVLKLIGADRQWPNLYDPKLVDLSADRMRFIGYERVGKGWHLQEWICALI